MSYRGSGPHIWVPRSSGLGAVVPGGYVIPTDAGQIKASLQSTATNYASGVKAEAQGYVTAEASAAARSAFTSATGVDTQWVPTDPKQVGPWAKQMVKVYGSKSMANGIELGKRALQDLHVPENPTGFASPLTEDETAQWATGYLAAHPELLTSPSPGSAVAMMQAFVSAQGNAIGLPPEFIAASQLARGFPTDIASSEKWGLMLGSAYLSQYGVPLVSDVSSTGFLVAAGRMGIAQVTPGVPFSLCEATYSALANGSINFSEATGLVVGACAWIGGAVGQAFGLPAPLGALLGQLIGSTLTGPVADALGFGPSDSEKLNAAQEAAAKASAAASVVCTDLAKALWLEYQQYWDSVQNNLQGLFRANEEWLHPPEGCGTTSGVMIFPESTPGENSLSYVLNAGGSHVLGPNGQPLTYPYPVNRYCGPMTGCAYNGTQIERFGIRDSYDLTMEALNKRRVPTIQWSGPYAGCDALGALAFWGAHRYVTPYQVMYAMHPGSTEKTCWPGYCVLPGRPNMWVRDYEYQPTQFDSANQKKWDGEVHSDAEYLENIGLVTTAGAAGEQVGECFTPEWAKRMFLSLQQAPAASALVQRDLARTVSYVTTQYGISKHMEELAGNLWHVTDAATKRQAARQAAARAAAFRNAVADARRQGRRKADLLNYGLLAAGGAALAGWATAKRSR